MRRAAPAARGKAPLGRGGASAQRKAPSRSRPVEVIEIDDDDDLDDVPLAQSTGHVNSARRPGPPKNSSPPSASIYLSTLPPQLKAGCTSAPLLLSADRRQTSISTRPRPRRRSTATSRKRSRPSERTAAGAASDVAHLARGRPSASNCNLSHLHRSPALNPKFGIRASLCATRLDGPACQRGSSRRRTTSSRVYSSTRPCSRRQGASGRRARWTTLRRVLA